MRKKIWILLSFLILQVAAFQSSAAIGDWKAYMAYSEVQEIEEAGNWIFVQASSNLYAYNRNDQSIQTFSKMDFLNDCDIQHIAYNKTAKRLLILYNNANIDLMNTQNGTLVGIGVELAIDQSGYAKVIKVLFFGFAKCAPWRAINDYFVVCLRHNSSIFSVNSVS